MLQTWKLVDVSTKMHTNKTSKKILDAVHGSNIYFSNINNVIIYEKTYALGSIKIKITIQVQR